MTRSLRSSDALHVSVHPDSQASILRGGSERLELATDWHSLCQCQSEKIFLLLHTRDDTPTSADNIKLLWLKCENVTETKNDHTEIHYFLCFVTEGVNNNDYLFCILLLQISDQFEYVLAYFSFTPKYNILGTFAWIRSLSVLANLVHAGVQF